MNLNIGNIGVWGYRHYDHLKKNHPSTVSVRMNGTLEGYLKQVNEHASEMLDAPIRQYAKDEEYKKMMAETISASAITFTTSSYISIITDAGLQGRQHDGRRAFRNRKRS